MASSHGRGSAGRFHHARSQIHRFLNCVGGDTHSVQNCSFAAADVILPASSAPAKVLPTATRPGPRSAATPRPSSCSAACRSKTPDRAARITEIDPETIRPLARDVAGHRTFIMVTWSGRRRGARPVRRGHRPCRQRPGQRRRRDRGQPGHPAGRGGASDRRLVRSAGAGRGRLARQARQPEGPDAGCRDLEARAGAEPEQLPRRGRKVRGRAPALSCLSPPPLKGRGAPSPDPLSP